ncbi:NAD(P)-binding domain-containing protein [Salinibacter altiplanensis]|uniref:NAD(P)-binding domain-containing protein n=1 Tax=Salinibacter altiplanensis TaxID=1803181 RepID=UPI000C9FA496|nr:NAD(P)-binding domain-containing protein [Salinibacter altiplanensis]
MQQQSVDVAIVGAGAAGVGFGVVLRDLGLDCFAILERDEVEASFEQWPEQMRFITPSFTGEAFGHLDLNSIALETSPAYALQHEHPSGPEYAQYLRNVASYFDLPIARGVEVTEIIP